MICKWQGILRSITEDAWNRPRLCLCRGFDPHRPYQKPGDSVALALLDLPKKTIKRCILVPSWSQRVPECRHR
jgi:hypothetical protein